MMRRSVMLSLVVIAANLSGCAYHMQCGPGGCGTFAGSAAKPCGWCGRVGCGGACRGRIGFGPLALARYMATCGVGCGGMYYNEWINDPPSNCDPCNDHGDWTGPQCCPSRMGRFLLGAHNLWGYRFDQGYGAAGGPGCAQQAQDGAIIDGEVIYDGPVRGSTGAGSGSGQGEEELLPPRPVPQPEPAQPRQTRSVKKPWRQSSTSQYYTRGTPR